MNRSDLFVPESDRKCLPEKGTGDGLTPSFPPEQEKIRRKGREYLIGKEVETQVSPVPRPLSAGMSFSVYLATAAFAHPFARDFASDAKHDEALPDPVSWPELAAYLRQCGACRNAVRGAMLAWRSFRSAQAQP